MIFLSTSGHDCCLQMALLCYLLMQIYCSVRLSNLKKDNTTVATNPDDRQSATPPELNKLYFTFPKLFPAWWDENSVTPLIRQKAAILKFEIQVNLVGSLWFSLFFFMRNFPCFLLLYYTFRPKVIHLIRLYCDLKNNTVIRLRYLTTAFE